MKTADRARSILHIDLDPFLVSVERSLDPELRGKPVIVGGQADGSGIVAAVSAEARAAGVRPGLTVVKARALCPEGAFRPGDLDTYARFSRDVTEVLLGASRRVERPSADEAYVDLTREGATGTSPVGAAEAIKDELQRRLGLDASLGLASSRIAARVASNWARPRGLLIVLPGYECSFLARQRVSFLPDLPPHLEALLEKAGLTTLGQVAEADRGLLVETVGELAAERLQQAARGAGEEPIPVTAPPSSIQEEAVLRDPRTDRASLEEILDGLVIRAFRRLRPFGLAAGALQVEVRRAEGHDRQSETWERPVTSGEEAVERGRALAAPLLEPATAVRGMQVRLSRLQKPDGQASLFPSARQL